VRYQVSIHGNRCPAGFQLKAIVLHYTVMTPRQGLTGAGILIALAIAVLGTVSPAAALETVATFASNCTTPKTVFQLGDTVCAKVDNVAGGDVNNIWLQWVAPDGTVAFGSVGTTKVTSSPTQTFTQALPTTGAKAQLGHWRARTANVSDSSPRVTANFRVPRVAVVGIRRGSDATFYSRNTNTTGFAEGTVALGNTTEDIGFWGDWTGIGTYSPGFYRPSDGTFHLSTVPGSGVADLVFAFGPVGGGSPVVGDWTGDGVTKIGVHQGDQFYLRNSNTAGPADVTFQYGLAGDQAVAGDWDGDGIDTIAVYRDGTVYIRNSNSTGFADITPFLYGTPGDTLIGGDWNGDNGVATIGVHRSTEGVFYLRNSNDTGFADVAFPYGIPGDQPVVNRANQAPVLTAGGTLNYTTNQAATPIDTTVTVTDMDSAVLIGATVQITGNCASGEDVLSFATQNGISGVYTPASCLMTLTGESSVANYQTALRSVKYNNSSGTPSALARTISWQVDDGAVANFLSNQPTSTTNIVQPPAITSLNNTTFAVGQAGTFTVTTTGIPSGASMVISESGSLPGGTVTFTDNHDGTATLAGTPNAGTGGTYPIIITANNGVAPQAQQNFTLTVNQAPAFTSNTSTTFAPGLAGQTFTVVTTGTPTNAITINSGAFPSNVTLTDNGNNTATIAGTPAAGTQGSSPYNLVFKASNSVVPDATQNFTFNVVCPTINVSGTIPALTYNVAMTAVTFTQSGGNGTITWSQTGLPTGVGINSGSGQVSGTPTVTGTFNVTITATDAGGCTGAKNQSVTVAPVANTDNYLTGLVDNTQLVITGGTTGSPATPFVGKTAKLTDNDTPTGGVNATAGTFATSAGGSVTIAADGTFIYTPKANPTAARTTSDSFTYTVTSNTGGGAAVTSAPATVNLTLVGRVWYVLNNAGVNGNGQSQSPFNVLSSAISASTAGTTATDTDTIFVYAGDGTTNNLATASILKAKQNFTGQGTALTVNGNTLVNAGSFPLIGNTLTLANDVVVNGIDMSTTTNSALVGASTTGLSVTVRNLTTSTGTVLNLSGATHPTGTVSLTKVTASGSGSGSVHFSLTNVDATVSVTDTTSSLAGAGTNTKAIDISGGTGSFTYPGTISNTGSGTNGGGISVASKTGSSTVTLSGTTITLNTGANTAFNMSGNSSGTTVNINPAGGGSGLDITTTSGTGFNATGGGTISVQGSGNTISSGTGTALNVTSTTIGASGLTFQSISANGGTNGIVLSSTGSSGGLTVTGTTGSTSKDGSGGTIQNMTGADASPVQNATVGIGVYMNNTRDVSLNHMNLHDFSNYAVIGTTVTNFTMTYSVVSGTNGTSQSGVGEGAVYFTGLSGSATIDHSDFSGGATDTFHVFNDGSQTLNRITITNCSFAMTNTTGSDAIGFQATGGTFNATIQSSTITAARSDLFQLNLLGTVTSDLVFGGASAALGNTLTNSNTNIVSGGGGVTIGGGGSTNNVTFTYNISHNSISGSHGAVLAVSKGTSGVGGGFTGGSFTGTIDSNTIGTQGVTGSGSTQGEGIAVFHDGTGTGGGTSNTTITNNHVSGVVGSRGAIDVFVHNGNLAQMTAVVQGNTIDTLDQTNSFAGMYLQTGSNTGAGGDNNKSCLTIGGTTAALKNNIDLGANAGGALVAGIVVEQEGVSRVGLLDTPNYSGAVYSDANVQTFVSNLNTVTNGNGALNTFAFHDSSSPSGGGYFGTCPP
jgi:hypothetical protein